jgi:mono/diheme cytochrome c family protein
MNNNDAQAVVIKNANGAAFAGSASCVGCHKSISDSHVHTAHFLTSQPAAEKYIKGSFEPGKNKFAFNGSVAVAMEKRNDGLYQVEYFRDTEKKARRFDMVIGSGTMGQSYLHWQDNNLLQLPITYFASANTWSNSPGFPDKVVFNRVITSRCLECHTSYMKSISEPGKEPEAFDKNQIMYGVDCEKCHGPAAEHVAFQSKNPAEKTGKFIVNPSSLTRQQNLDLCASCHGGRLQKIKPSFSFLVGDKLSDYFMVDTAAPDPSHIDVHGNQYGLLRASKCFRMSDVMTCNTCHNTHQTEKGQTALFSQRCMSCHTGEHNTPCKLQATMGATINTNCIDCHMPVQPSKAIAVQLEGSTTPLAALIRSHYISIYPQETQKVLSKMKH